jgi:hypothetical protein
MMDGNEHLFERAESAVERVKESSKQPRFAKPDPRKFFMSIFEWTQRAEDIEPAYKPDSRKRDNWLRAFVKQEPHLMGVINSVVAIDSNRGWSLTGGRNQVNRFTKVLHNFNVAPGIRGWRPGIKSASLAYYTADINAVVEIGRDGKRGPVRGFYPVDPARCRLSGNPDIPLRYYPAKGKPQDWTESDFLRVSGLVDTDETFNALSFCAASRSLELAKLMVAVYRHDQESLGSRAPKGLLLLKGISEGQWETSLDARADKLEGLERDYYGGVQVLASEGIDELDAKLVALSTLPSGFDLEKFTNLLMYGFALSFGYDPREFWPVSGGTLGTGKETETQHRKATGKGGLDFSLGFQEQLQRPDVLPPTLQFEFEQRDEEGELLEIGVKTAQVRLVREMYEAGLQATGVGLVSREEGRIPPEWTEAEEEVESTDTESVRVLTWKERLLERPGVQAALSAFPAEPIVSYRWPLQRFLTVYDPKTARRAFIMPKARKADSGDTVLYENEKQDFTITEGDVDRAVEKARDRGGEEIAEVLETPEVPEET